MEARGIRLQEERGISRQTIAQGMPECSDCTCMLVCASHYIMHTRPRVQRAPGIPCTLRFRRRGQVHASLGRNAPRERETVSIVIASAAKQSMARVLRRGLLRGARNDADGP